jgi:CDP-diacylglycerol--glycerol-3-phosphate 3-phosphatidyltransferase
MSWIDKFIRIHPELFVYQPAPVVHLHDRLLNRIFLWIIPAGVTPNHITFLRVLATPIIFLLILSERYYLGISLFAMAAATDAIDGSLARIRNQVTTFGILFDPLADKLLIGSMVLLVVFRHLSPVLAIMVLGVEIIIIMTAMVAKYRFKTVRMANNWGKIKMILQVIAVFCTLLALLLDYPYLLSIATWLFGVALCFAVMSLFSQSI